MGKHLLIASLLSVAILAAYYSTSGAKIDAFDEWKKTYGVSWHAEEEAYRRLIFEKNVVMINKHNADPTQTYQKGINQFTIYTDEEFVSKFLTPMPSVGKYLGDEEKDVKIIVGDIDWVAQGKVSPVKNQGNCGSCWAFSATGVLESWSLQKGSSVNLSEQQLVDCSRAQGNQGCSGGWPSSALNYVKIGGIASEAEYPYRAVNQNCARNGGAFKLASYASAAASCSALASALNTRPISVTVDATNWNTYKSGIFSNCAAGINHAVLLVGIVGGAWKIKNSWATSWGESGYIRLAGAGSASTCGICRNASPYPTA